MDAASYLVRVSESMREMLLPLTSVLAPNVTIGAMSALLGATVGMHPTTDEIDNRKVAEAYFLAGLRSAEKALREAVGDAVVH